MTLNPEITELVYGVDKEALDIASGRQVSSKCLLVIT
jgi:hypothetical protein